MSLKSSGALVSFFKDASKLALADGARATTVGAIFFAGQHAYDKIFSQAPNSLFAKSEASKESTTDFSEKYHGFSLPK